MNEKDQMSFQKIIEVRQKHSVPESFPCLNIFLDLTISFVWNSVQLEGVVLCLLTEFRFTSTAKHVSWCCFRRLKHCKIIYMVVVKLFTKTVKLIYTYNFLVIPWSHQKLMPFLFFFCIRRIRRWVIWECFKNKFAKYE